MAFIDKSIFRDWQDSEVIKAYDYKREREIFRVAINDTWDRFINEETDFQEMKSEIERLLNEAVTIADNEDGRVAAEIVREANEQVRQQTIQQAENAATYAQEQGTFAQEIVDNMRSVGPYSVSVQYKKNNFVRYDGNYYVAVSDSLGVSPLNTSFWHLVVERGIKGEQGIQGVEGTQGIQGEQGEKGNPFTYDDFTAPQLEGLRGPEGPKGEQGEEGPEGPQGPQGIPGRDGEGTGTVTSVNEIEPDELGNVDLGNLATDWDSITDKPTNLETTEGSQAKVNALKDVSVVERSMKFNSTDWNTILEPGMHPISVNPDFTFPPNFPTNGDGSYAYSWGMLLVLKGGSTVKQIYSETWDNYTYERTNNNVPNGRWSPWVQVESVSGAKSKANTAEQNARDYTDQQINALEIEVDYGGRYKFEYNPTNDSLILRVIPE